MSNPSPERVSARYLMKHAAEDVAEVTPARLVDLITFTLAFDALRVWASDPANDAGPLGKRGMTMLKRYSGTLSDGINQHIMPLSDRSDATPLRPAFLKAKRKGPPVVQAQRQAELFQTVLGWLKAHQTVFRDIFAGKAIRPAMQLASVADEENPTAILHKAATIPMVSGLSAPRKWIKEAAQLVGTSPTEMESVLVDAESADALAQELRKVQSLLDSADPMSEDFASLSEQKQTLLGQLENMAENSDRPEVVIASAASAVAEQPTSKTAKKAGLNDEQTKALLDEGKLVITAGAGAGKTRVMAAKIAYFVEEKGYSPDQILATSFTNKSATELEERVAEKFGITEARIGTTHSISREILFDFSDIPRDVIMKATKSGLISMLMKLALKQVELSPSAGGGGYGGGYSRRRRWAAAMGHKVAQGTTPYWKKAIGEWFNLGEKPVDNRGKPIGSKRISTAVGLFQNHNIPVERAWAENKGRENGNVMYYAAATYGAYEWLKKHDPNYGPALDFNDWLTEALKVVQTQPKALQALQRRFKVVLVDEAQDLNRVQHDLFSAIAAKADTFAMVGDDKQAIYAFRGAVPEEFTDLPNKGFQVDTLTMNYRSGKNIVDAANRLMTHSGERQIPMVCKADVERKGMGQIQAVELERHEDCAVLAAQEISEGVEAGASPKDFGVIVRNNGEADAFCLALMAKGIPFRSKANFFGKPAVKAMSAWVTIAAGGSDSEINDAVEEAHSTPGFFLNKQFVSGLRAQCPRGQNYLQFLLGGGGPYVGRESWRNERMVDPYARALQKISGLQGGSTEDVMRAILDLRGSKTTFMENLIDQVDPEDVAENNDTLEPTDEMIREAALSPLRPLMEMGKKFTDPKKFMDFLRKMVKANTKNRKEDDNPEPAVMVDTVHQWKGLERPNTYCVMAAGTFPHASTDEAFQAGDETAYDDERRIAYVALTRGEDSVTVLCPDENYMGRPAGPSRFVNEACIGIRGETEDEPDPEAEDNTMLQGVTASERGIGPSMFVAALDVFLGGGSLYDLFDDGEF